MRKRRFVVTRRITQQAELEAESESAAIILAKERFERYGIAGQQANWNVEETEERPEKMAVETEARPETGRPIR